jgi:N-acetylneuraminate synthase/N,N'-diacetyllegionaminate synthase
MSVFVVAEAGVSNYGDPELAHRQVRAAAEAQVDAVKFQVWRTDELVSRSTESGAHWHERLSARELPLEAWGELQAHAVECGLTFFATPHDATSLHFLVEELDVPLLKVGSGEASNWEFLRGVGSARRPVLIAFGLQSDDEAKRAVAVLRESGAPDVTVLHTVTIYPTPFRFADLGRMGRLAELVDAPVGYSDHTVGTHVALAAVALGAGTIEKHLTFDKSDERSLDNAGALEPAEWIGFVRAVRELEQALVRPSPAELDEARAEFRDWALQALVAGRDLEAGERLAASDLSAKRPARGGIPASELESVVGRRLLRPVAADEQIRFADLA